VSPNLSGPRPIGGDAKRIHGLPRVFARRSGALPAILRLGPVHTTGRPLIECGCRENEKFFPSRSGIFGINNDKSPVLAKKIPKKIPQPRSHFVTGRLISGGELLEYRKLRLRDAHPGTPLVLVSANGSPYLRCPLYPPQRTIGSPRFALVQKPCKYVRLHSHILIAPDRCGSPKAAHIRGGRKGVGHATDDQQIDGSQSRNG
jgi:hypothetical protein